MVGPTWAQGADLPGVIDGDRVDFQNLVSYVNSQPVTSTAVYSTIARRLDLTNFADYCILNSYAAMGDWPANNWRAGRDRAANGVWRFVVWDAEWGMGIYGRSVTINSFTQTGGGPNDSGLGSVSSSEIAQCTTGSAPARNFACCGRIACKSIFSMAARSPAPTSRIALMNCATSWRR